MKIKTVQGRLDNCSGFDARVNVLLAEGWKLSRREVLETVGPYVCYAELVKLDEADMEPQEADPVTWQEAVDILRETCREVEKCGTDCPMWAWCQKHLATPPANWLEPAE